MNSGMMGAKEYSRSQVSARNGKDGKAAWVIVEKSVYDVTKILTEHSGGAEVLLDVAGKDGTEEYIEAGHSLGARGELRKLFIGVLKEEKSESEEVDSISTIILEDDIKVDNGKLDEENLDYTEEDSIIEDEDEEELIFTEEDEDKSLESEHSTFGSDSDSISIIIVDEEETGNAECERETEREYTNFEKEIYKDSSKVETELNELNLKSQLDVESKINENKDTIPSKEKLSIFIEKSDDLKDAKSELVVNEEDFILKIVIEDEHKELLNNVKIDENKLSLDPEDLVPPLNEELKIGQRHEVEYQRHEQKDKDRKIVTGSLGDKTLSITISKSVNVLAVSIPTPSRPISTLSTQHSGGAEVLLDVAGKDGTEEYIEAGHSLGARGELRKLFIGVLKEEKSESEEVDSISTIILEDDIKVDNGKLDEENLDYTEEDSIIEDEDEEELIFTEEDEDKSLESEHSTFGSDSDSISIIIVDEEETGNAECERETEREYTNFEKEIYKDSSKVETELNELNLKSQLDVESKINENKDTIPSKEKLSIFIEKSDDLKDAKSELVVNEEDFILKIVIEDEHKELLNNVKIDENKLSLDPEDLVPPLNEELKIGQRHEVEYQRHEQKDKDRKIVTVRKMTEAKEYTLEEVSKNDGNGGKPQWIVIKDEVYDLTNFLDEHPGGPEVITEVSGKDATKDFDDVGHSKDAIRIMKQYRIGEIVEAERKYERPKSNEADSGTQRSCLAIITCGLCG